jgi:hypothetical protein
VGQDTADKLFQNLELLKRKLELFKIYPVQILRKISKKSYIVSLFGVELIAQSDIQFKTKSGFVQVVAFSPSIHLKFINPAYTFDKTYNAFIAQNEIELDPYNQFIFHILSKNPATISNAKLLERVKVLQKTFDNFDYDGLLPLENAVRHIIHSDTSVNCFKALEEAFLSKTSMKPEMVVTKVIQTLLQKKYEKSCFISEMLPDQYRIFNVAIDEQCNIIVEREDKGLFRKTYFRVQQTSFPKFSVRITRMEDEVTILLFVEQNLIESQFDGIRSKIKAILDEYNITLIHVGLEIKPILSIREHLNRHLNN